MGRDWSHTLETQCQHHQAGLYVESPRYKKERSVSKHLVLGPQDRHQAKQAEMETAGEESSGQKTLVDCGQRFMLHEMAQ